MLIVSSIFYLIAKFLKFLFNFLNLLGGPSITSGESPHMLHYAHELARKDVDITVLRRTLRELDDKYRDVIREKTLAEDSWTERERKLLDNISRYTFHYLMKRFFSRNVFKDMPSSSI